MGQDNMDVVAKYAMGMTLQPHQPKCITPPSNRTSGWNMSR